MTFNFYYLVTRSVRDLFFFLFIEVSKKNFQDKKGLKSDTM